MSLQGLPMAHGLMSKLIRLLVRAPHHLAWPPGAAWLPLSALGTLCFSHADLLTVQYPCFWGSVPGMPSLSILD